MSQTVPILILAGGYSSRMGRDKAHVLLGSDSLLDRMVSAMRRQSPDVVINSNCDLPATLVHLAHVRDAEGERYGPLSGILTGMRYFAKHSDASHFMTASVDCPFLPADLLHAFTLLRHSVNSVVIARSNGHEHPTVGLWPVALRESLQEWLNTTKRYSVKAFLQQCDVRYADFPLIETAQGAIDPFFNINTPDDLVEAHGNLTAINAQAKNKKS